MEEVNRIIENMQINNEILKIGNLMKLSNQSLKKILKMDFGEIEKLARNILNKMISGFTLLHIYIYIY